MLYSHFFHVSCHRCFTRPTIVTNVLLSSSVTKTKGGHLMLYCTQAAKLSSTTQRHSHSLSRLSEEGQIPYEIGRSQSRQSKIRLHHFVDISVHVNERMCRGRHYIITLLFCMWVKWKALWVVYRSGCCIILEVNFVIAKFAYRQCMLVCVVMHFSIQMWWSELLVTINMPNVAISDICLKQPSHKNS